MPCSYILLKDHWADGENNNGNNSEVRLLILSKEFRGVHVPVLIPSLSDINILLQLIVSHKRYHLASGRDAHGFVASVVQSCLPSVSDHLNRWRNMTGWDTMGMWPDRSAICLAWEEVKFCYGQLTSEQLYQLLRGQLKCCLSLFAVRTVSEKQKKKAKWSLSLKKSESTACCFSLE